MNKILEKSTLTNIILFLFIVLVGIFAFNQYSQKADLKQSIKILNDELQSEKEYNEIYNNTKKFIELASEGNHASLLSGSAKKEYDDYIENVGTEAHNHGESLVEDIKVLNVYGTKTEQDKGESFAIYQVFYGQSSESKTPINMQRIVTLSLHAKWEKVNDTYKVYNYKINLLEDSLDKYLQKLRTIEGGVENENE